MTKDLQRQQKRREQDYAQVTKDREKIAKKTRLNQDKKDTVKVEK